jgi:hypothetical protein
LYRKTLSGFVAERRTTAASMETAIGLMSVRQANGGRVGVLSGLLFVIMAGIIADTVVTGL